jgi:hypothetical protein
MLDQEKQNARNAFIDKVITQSKGRVTWMGSVSSLVAASIISAIGGDLFHPFGVALHAILGKHS